MEDSQAFPSKITGIQVIPESSGFALLEFDQALDPLQQKLYYMAVASVDKNEDPEAQALYRLDIAKMADFSGVGLRTLRRNLESVVASLNDMDIKLRSAYVEDGKLKVMFGIFQGLEIDLDDPNSISVRFNYDFRKQILKMKREYDIEYPTKTIMKLSGKFSIPLYTYLIAEAAIIREKRSLSEMSDLFIIRVDKDALLRRLNYTNTIGMFNNRALPLAIKDLNENSEIYIEDGMPKVIKQGRSIVAYEFRVRITTSIEKPIFSRSLLESRYDLVPEMEYLMHRLKEMGLAPSHIKHFQAEATPNRFRIWGNMLYTWYCVGDKQPAYFRKSYDQDWFYESCHNSTEKLFRLVVTEKPEVVDGYMRALHEEYTKRGLYRDDPSFVNDILKHFKNHTK